MSHKNPTFNWLNVYGFQRHEFACECGCGFDSVDIELLQVLQAVKAFFNGAAITITSPNRCITHDESVQLEYNPNYIAFSSKSQHMNGKAADIKVKGVHADEVAAYLEATYRDTYGIGRYNGRTHIDVRTVKARWDKR